MYQGTTQFTDPYNVIFYINSQSLYQNQYQDIDIPEQTYVFERIQQNLPQQQQQDSDL